MNTGIDLGATLSVIAVKGHVELAPGYSGSEYLADIDVTILPSATGNLAIPSVMWWHPDEPDRYVFGDEAKQLAEVGRSPIMFWKSSIGTTNPLMLNGRVFSAKEVAARFLRYLRVWAETVTGQSIARVVLTHPTYFTAEQREELTLAARDAGLAITAEQLMMEPCAAVLAHTKSVPRGDLRIMSYDLGGSTFNVTVVQRLGGNPQIKAFSGDPFVGGVTFDSALVRWVLDQLAAKGKTIPHDDSNAEHRGRRSRLMQVAEAVKVRLAEQRTNEISVPVQVDFLVDDRGRRVQFLGQINREQYAALIGHALRKTIDCCRVALTRADVAPEDLKAILLVGGSTKGPWVADAVANAFGAVHNPYYPDLCTAAGAAIAAAKIDRIHVFREPIGDPLIEYTNLQDLLSQARSDFPLLRSVESYLFAMDPLRSTSASTSELVSRLAWRPEEGGAERLGPFLIQKLLGRGAFSSVYLAVDVDSAIKRVVALKVPIQSRGLERLQQEALLWQSLSLIGHPNILQFEDLKHIGGNVFFVMEYMSGGNLDGALEGMTGERRIEAIIRSLEPICAGLAFAHRRGVVHGDVKPQNILVQGAQVKLADFGVSFTIGDDETPPTDRMFGPTMFLPPESFEGVRTPSMDVYALGVTLYYLLTSEYPFQRFVKDVEELRTAKLWYRPSVRAICPAVPPWLDEMIQRCMAPRMEDRFRDGQELLDHVRFNHVIVAAHWNIDSKTALFDLDVQGIRAKELLHHQIADGNIDGLCAAWDRLGHLALERAVVDAALHAQVDGRIGETLEHVSRLGPRFILDARMPAALAGARIASLWLRCDPRLMALPWELFRIGNTYACLEFPVARWPMMVQSTPTTKTRTRSQTRRMLIFVDPSGDLVGAVAEYQGLRQEIDRASAATLTVEVSDASDTAYDLRVKMERCDIVHFIGHTFYVDDQGNLTKCGWLLKNSLAGREVLRTSELAELWDGVGPTLVFANSCQSARSSAASVRTSLRSDTALGLASAFLSSGVANYIGAVWDVPDTMPATRHLAISFYRELLAGASIGNALHVARIECAREFGVEDLTWARYVHCGDPSARLFPQA